MAAILSALQFILLEFLCGGLMLFVSHTHSLTHTLTSFTFALSKPASSLEAGARRHLVGGPVLEAGGGRGQQFLQVNPVTFQLMDFVYFHKT